MVALLFAITLVLAVLKFIGVAFAAALSWWTVFTPALIGLLIVVIVVVLIGSAACVFAR